VTFDFQESYNERERLRASARTCERATTTYSATAALAGAWTLEPLQQRRARREHVARSAASQRRGPLVWRSGLRSSSCDCAGSTRDEEVPEEATEPCRPHT
jgi:hypothetical protein